jgi:flavin-dependent dehydrogenase
MRLDKYKDIDKSLEDMVDIFLEMPEIKKRLKNGGKLNDIAKWQLDFGSQSMQRAYDGALLVGDAAGLINPLTGGGIHNGLQSALIASQIIDAALAKDDTSFEQLQIFDKKIDDNLKKNMRKSHLIQRGLIYLPMSVDLLIRWGGANSGVAKIFVDKL